MGVNCSGSFYIVASLYSANYTIIIIVVVIIIINTSLAQRFGVFVVIVGTL